MSENIIYADLNLTESTRPRLQKVTDVQDPTYAEVKVQSLDTNALASYTASDPSCHTETINFKGSREGTSCSSRTRVAVFVALIILLLALAVYLMVLYLPTASSRPGPEMSSNTSEEALDLPTASNTSGSETSSNTPEEASDLPTASSSPGSETSSNTPEEASETGLDPSWSGENGKHSHKGCPRDWERHGGKCYFFAQGQELKDWNASREECTEMNSDLVIIENLDELNYLFSQSKGHYYFLGLICSGSEEKWKWINNMELNTDIFKVEGKYSDYCCAVVGRDRKVESASCSGSSTTRYMCEKAANILEEQKEN